MFQLLSWGLRFIQKTTGTYFPFASLNVVGVPDKANLTATAVRSSLSASAVGTLLLTTDIDIPGVTDGH